VGKLRGKRNIYTTMAHFEVEKIIFLCVSDFSSKLYSNQSILLEIYSSSFITTNGSKI
jgi:hypothetical protein